MTEPTQDGAPPTAAAQPQVSIAMPVYNAARTLELTLRSVLAQTYRNWELLLIDDGSRDATLAIANACTDPRVRVISGGPNAGLAARLNQAIGLARGEFIARMDGDDIAYPERLTAQVKFLLDHPECDLVGAAALIFDDGGTVRGRFPLHSTHEQICATPWRGFGLPHPTWMGRRDWFARFGYRPDYKKAEDFDLLLRAYQHSRFACLEDILLGYRQDRRTLKKLLGGRLYTSRSIARESWRQGALGAGLAGLAGQGIKALVDLAAVPMGWDEQLRGESADAVTPAEQQAWRAVWTALMPENGSK
ncbi:MAG TPA: glycosyltransferase [Burkholderiales bacterium]|jgi:glycosyltransferase involved in cell wall biosynthesis|nr:glycosyltransferase [Burkholderiales bacterium]